MKQTNTFGIHFVIRSSNQQKNAMASVFARISVNGRKSEISFRAKVSAKQWDQVKGKAKGRQENIIKLNNYIERVRSLITDCYHQLIQQREPVTVETVKSLYLGENSEEETMTLMKLLDYHKQVETGRLAPGTLKNYTTTVSYLKKFIQKQYKTADILLDKLNYKFMLDFERYLHNHKPTDHQRPMSNNGVMKHLERLKKLANMAVTMDWLEKALFLSINCILKK